MKKLVLCCVLIVLVLSASHVANRERVRSIIAADALPRFTLHIRQGEAKAALEAATSQESRHWRITSTRGFSNPWDAELSTPVEQPVRPQDVLLVRFRVRGEGRRESGEARAELTLEQPKEPYNRSFTFPFSAGRRWREFTIPFRNLEDLPAGSAFLVFRVGFEKQELEIADVEVLNYGPGQDLSQLPLKVPSYAGIEADAPWRRAAQERIERYRKGDVTIKVVDKGGLPISGATVDLRMVRQAYGFGSAVSASRIADDGDDLSGNQKYRSMIEQLFNMVNFENDLKWNRWENQDHRLLFRALDWLDQRRIEVRGCCLVWDGWDHLPKHLRQLEDDPLELRQRVEGHIHSIMTATRNRIAEWDVVNEPYANRFLMDRLGRGVMVEWFTKARQADPRPVLYVNDYAGFMVGGEDSPHKDTFEETLRFLQAQGAPIGGLGIQAHFGWDLTPPERLVSELDRWARLGLKIAITEFDVDITDERLQGQYLRDFMTAVFSHPATHSIGIWGFWEKTHWQPNAALFRTDWSVKPAGQAWMDLVLKEWRTNVTAVTDSAGSLKIRGFLGDYLVTAKSGSAVTSRPVTLPRGGTTAVLQLSN